MFRLFTRSASVFIVLFALVAVQAQAGNSYLFRANDEEIDAVMSHYFPKGYDREAARQQLSAPFDCRNYGDLCREVGEESAYQVLRVVWEEAKRQTPRRNISGKYKPAKADRLQTSGTVIVDKLLEDPVGFPISETKDDTKQVMPHVPRLPTRPM